MVLIDFEVIDFESITVSTKAVGLNLEKLKRGGVFITVEKAAISYRFDGKNATAGIGHVANDGDPILIRNAKAALKLSMRRKNSTDAVIRVSYLEL